MTKRLLLSCVLFIAAFAGSALSLGALDEPVSAAAGDGGYVDHPGLVPDVPENGYPIIRDTPYIGNLPRQTRSVDLIGNYILSGGNFLDVELQNGQVVSRRHLAIFDWRDKSLVCSTLDVDDEVLAIAPGPDPQTALIGGRFDKVTGADGIERTRNKIALINMEDCSVDTSWIVNGLNGKVTELAVSGTRLFIGGDFTSIEGNSIERLAEVDYNTAAVNTAFDFTFGGELSRAIVGMEPNSAGTRLGIIHRATSIDGNSMRGTAVFNISNPANPTLTAHRMATNIPAYSYYYDIQDGAVSPDFTKMATVQGTATVSDYTTAVPTTEASGQHSWTHFMRDSSFGVAMTNDTVYVAGHFCKIDAGPGATQTMAPNSGPSSCTGVFFGGGAWRTQIAALDINDGTPQTWNPGNDAFRGGTAVTVVNRGLLVGYDGDRTNHIRVGTTAFFDFGAPPDPREDQTCTAAVNGFDVDLTWDAVAGIDSYHVRRNNSWIASPGNVTSYTDTPPAGTHTYEIRTYLDGVVWDTTCEPTVTVDPPDPQTCTATLNPDDSITLTWDAIAGEDNYTVRRNGGWVATAGNVLTYDHSPGPGIHTYVIRSRMNGLTTNTTCAPTITVEDPPPPPAQKCSYIVGAGGEYILTWTPIAGEDNYIVRKNNSWLATVGNVVTYTDVDGQPGDDYVIRSYMAGNTTDTTCTPG